jgi:antitoxin component YwqK of YwqJK toxin-antitoxin module
MLNTDNMNKLNEQGQKHGPWERYYANGKLRFKKNYLNGQAHGLWEEYNTNGNLMYKRNYLNGQEHGL